MPATRWRASKSGATAKSSSCPRGQPRRVRSKRTLGMRSSMNRLPYVQEYRDRHGKIRRYFRRPGSRRIPLPGRPGSQEFMTAGYVVREMKTVGKNRSAPGSLSAAIAAYYTDRSFTGELAAETQQQRRTILERFRTEHGNKPIARIVGEDAVGGIELAHCHSRSD